MVVLSEEFLLELHKKGELLTDYAFNLAVYDEAFNGPLAVTLSKFSFLPQGPAGPKTLTRPCLLDIDFSKGSLFVKSVPDGLVNEIDLDTASIEMRTTSSVGFKMDQSYIQSGLKSSTGTPAREKITLEEGFALSGIGFSFFEDKLLFGRLSISLRYFLRRRNAPILIYENKVLEIDIPALKICGCDQIFRDTTNFIFKGLGAKSNETNF